MAAAGFTALWEFGAAPARQAEFEALTTHEAPVFAWNAASMRVLEKCGYVREGVLKNSVFKDGEVIDSVLYAKVAP